MGAKNALLVLPANMIQDTRKKWAEYAKDWRIPRCPEMVSYESFGPASGKGLLERLNPDLLILDEAHLLRSTKSSRYRKFRRFLKLGTCRCCAMTGTFAKRRIEDYAHIMHWCLGPLAPVPITGDEIENWDHALAEKIEVGSRIEPGPLLDWYEPSPLDAGRHVGTLERARRGFQKRLAETPGVVCSYISGADLGVSLTVVGHELYSEDVPALQSAFEDLRGPRTLPDGQEMVDAIEWYRHAKELGLGFFLKWKYPAPPEWLACRKAWFAFCREKLARSRTYDSPDELAKAFPEQPEWLAWKAVRKSYDPETIPIWLETGIAELCVSWLRGDWGDVSPGSGGIVFVEHVAFGQLVASLAGVPYFGAGGKDATGRSIIHFNGPACVASIGSNGKGRNLQAFQRMLVPSPPPNGPQWEQLIGRLHRQGQGRDVRIDVLFGCREAYQSFWQAVSDCIYVEQSQGLEQKLGCADIHVGQCPTQGSQWL
jgi:hypothetical protein